MGSLLVLALLPGCAQYATMARAEGATELRCPAQQLEVEQTTNGSYPVLFAVTGCGERADVECWQGEGRASDFCGVRDSTRRPRRVMSLDEASCRTRCREIARACSSGCSASFNCSTFCLSFEDGCVNGCIRAVANP